MTTRSSFEDAVYTRAGAKCELCAATDALDVHPVVPGDEGDADRSLLACGACRAQLAPGAPLDPRRWFCLKEAIWSEVPAVQVVAWRLLRRLDGESWARDALEGAYLEESVLAWAEDGAEAAVRVVDCNGAALADGDTVTLIKDLDVKGAGFTAKRGTVVKGIRIGSDPDHVEGRVNKTAIMLKTCFLKKLV